MITEKKEFGIYLSISRHRQFCPFSSFSTRLENFFITSPAYRFGRFRFNKHGVRCGRIFFSYFPCFVPV
uniref:Uncharacterized protein n=1 Tax=Manihot esculenta TaxID=3983 RepID=A0A2C9UB63_MANES